MTRTTVSGIRPDKTGTGEWIDINSHVGRLMSTIMAGGRPFSIDVTPAGMTIVTPLPPPAVGPDTEAAGGDDSKIETDPHGERITSRKTLYERFKTKLKANLDERKQ
ncbi:hypothetical protein NRBB56_1223 [Bifidobacterium breve]|uniref:hypothetical protein n=1 Tax=Bifidobacterium breve TaxID=1685 RepID=UPI000CA0AFE2|nr:hypothetical protein [Bifidobacterium breve]AUD85257.1 hypothetical protein NRBB56_1223 [Bifidobacterium breve]